jgi:hypothetical protein
MDFNRSARLAVPRLLSMGAVLAALTGVAVAQEPGPPPPPPGGMMMTMQGPHGGGAFFHEEVGLGDKVVTGAPMTASVTVTHDTTLADGNTIHTETQSTEYRDSQGRVRREVPFKLVTTATGATQGTMVIIMDPVAGKRYILNPQKKTAHEMPLHPPRPQPGDWRGQHYHSISRHEDNSRITGAGYRSHPHHSGRRDWQRQANRGDHRTLGFYRLAGSVDHETRRSDDGNHDHDRHQRYAWRAGCDAVPVAVGL